MPENQKRTILIRRRKKVNRSKTKRYMDNFEEWLGYLKLNPHRFITDYLGLRLYAFQKVLVYMMFKYPSFVFVASRGLRFIWPFRRKRLNENRAKSVEVFIRLYRGKQSDCERLTATVTHSG